MLDIKEIRNDPKGVEKALQTRDIEITLEPILAIDERLRHVKHEAEELKSLRNAKSKEIGEKKRKGQSVEELMADVAGLGDKIALLDQELAHLENELHEKISYLPNIPSKELKVSLKPSENVVLKEFKKRPHFSFAPKNHLELNETLHLFDFKRGAKVAGTGWPVYVGMGARLEWALLNYMIETHLKNGFQFVLPPHLVRQEILFGSGQLPKFKDQAFHLNDKDYPLYLIPTSEVPINGLYYDEIIERDHLPFKYISYTPCFRREAGAAGAQERGLIRIHQFNKVEMFCFATPDQSEEVFDQMVASAEEILQGLDIHYRNMLLVTGDTSFAARKTIDIEVWLPGQDRYYEVSSVSHCGDFQARRSKTRFKHGNDKPHFVHTLNGSGLATSRLMVALLENFQNEEGIVQIPAVLQKYLDGKRSLP